MKMKIVASNVLFLLVLTTTPAIAGWDLTPCGDSAQKAAQERLRAMRSAPPESPLYVPHPYPKLDDEVVENFLSYHVRSFSDSLASLSPEEQRFFDALNQGRLKHRVLRVANWTPLRCGRDRPRAFYFLVRFFDSSDGKEITRVAVNDDGLPSSLIHRPVEPALEQYPPAFADLEEATERARTGTERKSLRDAQYVTTWGTIRCSVLTPCVAVRDARGPLLIRGTDLFQVEADRAFSTAGAGAPRSDRSVVEDHRRRGEHLISLGRGAFAPLVPVSP